MIKFGFSHTVSGFYVIFSRLIRLFAVLSSLLLSWPAFADEREDAFVDRMVSEHGFSAEQVSGWLQQAQVRESILAAMVRPAESSTWPEYRARFVQEKRIGGGLSFWQDNAAWLEQADCRYGVTPEYVVAIIGVETFYGRNTGRFPILDALVTLGFHYPPRADYFSGELEQYFLLIREEGKDPLSLKGSYAGAMGLPQFMPTSFRRWAVDFDADGQRDIWSSKADAIGSVANYFKVFGWQSGEPVLLSTAVPDSTVVDSIMTQEFSARLRTLAEWRAMGLSFDAAGMPETAVARLFSLDDGVQRAWYLGLNNFYVITRYNRSVYYAMAVHELAQALRAGAVTRQAQCG